jgi:hypothetical protein
MTLTAVTPTSPSARSVTLRLPFTHPPLTANEARSRSNHWAPQHRAKKEVEPAVIALCRHHKVPRFDRVAITLTWFVPDYQRRDCGGPF